MRHHSGFTWLEALVVVTILAVLAAILFPVFGRSRDYGPRRTACQSNLKQIMLGFKQYTQDYDDYFPLGNGRVFAPTLPPSNGWVNATQPYLKSLQIFQCDKEPNSVLGNSDYALNTVVTGHTYNGFDNSANTVSLCEIPETPGATALASGPVVRDRHLEGSNYGFVDGHVKWLQSTKAATPSNVPATGSNFTFGR